MTTRRRFTADFKAKVALEALRGDKTIQGEEDHKTIQRIVFLTNAARHKVHPNQVSAWKRRAMDGLGEVFSNGAERSRSDRETEVRELHAKIGDLTVVNDLLARGLKR